MLFFLFCSFLVANIVYKRIFSLKWEAVECSLLRMCLNKVLVYFLFLSLPHLCFIVSVFFLFFSLYSCSISFSLFVSKCDYLDFLFVCHVISLWLGIYWIKLHLFKLQYHDYTLSVMYLIVSSSTVRKSCWFKYFFFFIFIFVEHAKVCANRQHFEHFPVRVNYIEFIETFFVAYSANKFPVSGFAIIRLQFIYWCGFQ